MKLALTKKNLLLLAVIVLVAVLAYTGLLSMLGFFKYWGIWRMIFFFLITYGVAFSPMWVLLKLYMKMNPGK